MTDSLFRQEALDAQKNKMMGSVSLYCPPYRWLVILLVSFFTILIMGFLFFGHYTKRETASGQLLPKDGVYNVTAPSTGTVTRMLVKEGSKVEKGMPLLEISSEISTSMGQTREFVRSQLIMQQARLKAQLEGVQELAQETSHGLKNQLTTLDSQVGLLKQQQSQRRQQLTLAQRQLEKLTAMRNEGFASNHQIDEQTSNVLESNARLQEVNRQSM